MKKLRGGGGINDFVCNLMINGRIASNKKGGAVFLFRMIWEFHFVNKFEKSLLVSKATFGG